MFSVHFMYNKSSLVNHRLDFSHMLLFRKAVQPVWTCVDKVSRGLKKKVSKNPKMNWMRVVIQMSASLSFCDDFKA